MLNIIRKILINKRDAKIISRKNKIKEIIEKKKLNFKIKSFGNKNPNKFFYVIQRSPGGGMFSNLNYVIHHLYLAEKLNFIPVVDMANFPTLYNENKSIMGTLNSWEYFFEPVSPYTLKEVYKSKNVVITDKNTKKNKFFDGLRYLTNDHKKIFFKYIKIKKYLIKEKNNFLTKKLKNKNFLGVHFRGTDYKNRERHPLPATKKQIVKNINILKKKFNFDYIFLVTEEKDYLNYLKKEFKNVISYSKLYTNKNQIFFESQIKDLRYKIGKTNIIDMLILAHSKHLLGIDSNLTDASIYFSKKKIPFTKIFNGYNSNNIFFAQIKWYIKKNLPYFLGGFKDN